MATHYSCDVCGSGIRGSGNIWYFKLGRDKVRKEKGDPVELELCTKCRDAVLGYINGRKDDEHEPA